MDLPVLKSALFLFHGDETHTVPVNLVFRSIEPGSQLHCFSECHVMSYRSDSQSSPKRRCYEITRVKKILPKREEKVFGAWKKNSGAETFGSIRLSISGVDIPTTQHLKPAMEIKNRDAGHIQKRRTMLYCTSHILERCIMMPYDCNQAKRTINILQPFKSGTQICLPAVNSLEGIM